MLRAHLQATLQAPPPPTRSVGVSGANAELVLRSEELRAKLAEVERQRAMTTTGGLRSRMLDEEADAADAVCPALQKQDAFVRLSRWPHRYIVGTL